MDGDSDGSVSVDLVDDVMEDDDVDFGRRKVRDAATK